jgi:hypothetical protein
VSDLGLRRGTGGFAKSSASVDFDQEAAQRRDNALRRALNTPPQPRHGKVKESTARQPVRGAKPKKRGQPGAAS